MRLSSRTLAARCAAIAMTFACLALAAKSRAASISYGNLGPIAPGYSFVNIVESSGTDGVPLYGPPSPFVIGLDFTPTSFGAASAGGGADLTDGQLNYTVVAGPGAPGIPLISFAEGGTFTLGGTGTAATQVLAGASIAATIREINGVSVTPIPLAPVTASANYNLAASPGAGQLWSLSASINVTAQLAGLGYGPGQLATRADVVIDNSLVAVSEALGAATISKGDFGVTVTPEPTSCAMMLIAACGLGLARSSKRRA
jgi:hypothetical protein